MKKHGALALVAVLALLCLALPVSANSSGQGGGGIRWGPYTLSAGDSASGDLTVFGPVTLREDSFFDGDLTVFGEVLIEYGATMDGTLVVMGTLELAGTVDGDVFAAGTATLEESAYVSGDLSAVSGVLQDGEAIVDGDIVLLDEDDFDWDIPPFPGADLHVNQRPFWITWVWNGMRAIFSTLVMGLIALVLVSVWPQQVEQVSQTIESAPLTTFGIGLLVWLLTPLVFVLLAITLCLLPLGIVGLVIVGIGVLLGIVALGAILGRRVWCQVYKQPQPNAVVTTVLGTSILTLLLLLAKIIWPLHSLLLFVLIPPAAGAVLLTRFGMVPYASNGKSVFAPRVPPPAALSPVPFVEDVAAEVQEGVPFDDGEDDLSGV